MLTISKTYLVDQSNWNWIFVYLVSPLLGSVRSEMCLLSAAGVVVDSPLQGKWPTLSIISPFICVKPSAHRHILAPPVSRLMHQSYTLKSTVFRFRVAVLQPLPKERVICISPNQLTLYIFQWPSKAVVMVPFLTNI